MFEQLDMFQEESAILCKLESMEKTYIKELTSKRAWSGRIHKRIRELEDALWNIHEHQKLIKKTG